METIKTIKEIKKLKKNKIICENVTVENSEIIFEGENNVLFCEPNVKIKNSTIKFGANNALIYLSSNNDCYLINAYIHNNSVLYFGDNNYMNNNLTLVLSEEQNIIIGNDCLFSYGITFRTADPHLIYDYKTKKRTNPSKSIYIGDHVWVGQNALILKGTKAGSGSIIAAGAISGNKEIPSNEVWGGNPIKKMKENICWSRECVHKWTKKTAKEYSTLKTDEYYYKTVKENQQINNLEKALNNEKEANKKIDIIVEKIKKGKRDLFSIKNPNRIYKKIKSNKLLKKIVKKLKSIIKLKK